MLKKLFVGNFDVFVEIIEIGGFWADWDSAGKFVSLSPPHSPGGKYEKLGRWKFVVWTLGYEKREQCRVWQCTLHKKC
jgi:hypothetical protein